jgi:hypothetical protein
MTLTFHPTYPGGRIIARLGEHEVGAITFLHGALNGITGECYWQFRLTGMWGDGCATSEQAAKDALTAKAREWLVKAGLG